MAFRLEVESMRQRRWTVEEKLAIVMEELKEKSCVSEICREHRISQDVLLAVAE